MTSDWRVPVNQLLYILRFTKDTTEEMIDFSADSAVRYRTLDLGPEVYRCAISQALASGERLDSSSLLPQFGQAEIAEFLSGVAARLDESSPWPEPEFRRLDSRTWEEFANPVPTARLDASLVEVTDLLQKGFRQADIQSGIQVLMLRLRTGETVALLGRDGRDEKVTLLTDATGDPTDVIEHFVAATGFPAEKVARI